jgi:hypothetical protein
MTAFIEKHALDADYGVLRNTPEIMGKPADGLSFGLRLIHECNLACAHCYDRVESLFSSMTSSVCESVPVQPGKLWDR